MDNQHKPVLINQILEFFKTDLISKNPKLKVFDGTLGGGGYTNEFLNLNCQVFACDLDKDSIFHFQSSLSEELKKNLSIENANFSNYIGSFEDNFFDFIVVDLGFSSNQLGYSKRGFSYQNPDEVLDLRYDKESGQSCSELLKQVQSAYDLSKILYNYSGESLSRRISPNLFMLAKNKQNQDITVAEVIECIKSSIPAKFFSKTNAILSRVWQALRIWTNNEFENLERFLPIALTKLKSEGSLAVVSFHSLEDKIVTKLMRQVSKPIEIDDFGNKLQFYKLLTTKAIGPDLEEIQENKRSRSALLRIIKKTAEV